MTPFEKKKSTQVILLLIFELQLAVIKLTD